MSAPEHADAVLEALRRNLHVLGELAVRYEVELRPERSDDAPTIGSPQDVQRLLGPEMGTLAQEQVRVLLLDRRNRVVAQRVVYQGNSYESICRWSAIPSALTGQRICPSMKEVTLHQHEQARLHVFNSVIAGEIEISEAAALMDLSTRHARRLLSAYRKRGARALAHGNRGRRPHNAVPEDLTAEVARLAATRYDGANHSHLTELLDEREGIALSRSTVRRILTRAGILSPRRRRPPLHRARRERMPREGMLLQVDGSHHAWLGERSPRFALLLAVDDATGAVVHALFRPAEDARGYFRLMEQVVLSRGIPLALYSDRHAVFRASVRRRGEHEASTQFARAMAELGVRQIFARSPQAKGRVERAAGTFQDRLVTELRLAQASTLAEAQVVLERFLPRVNDRFAVAAREPELAWRPLGPSLDLDAILCFRHLRTVARDNTVKYSWRTLQLLPSPQRPSYAGARVEVLESPGGELAVRCQGEIIPSQLASPRAGVLRERRSELARDPALERVVAGLGSGGAPPGRPALPAATNGNGAAPQATVKALRPPTTRQAARWKAIEQAQLQGLSQRATARLLGISRSTVSNYVRAGGPPGRQPVASS